MGFHIGLGEVAGRALVPETDNPPGSPITKSMSTPASLQTIVRFHNGSNMSLHHRVSFETALEVLRALDLTVNGVTAFFVYVVSFQPDSSDPKSWLRRLY